MISDGQWDSVFGLGFGRLQGGFSADVVDTFQSISDDRVWIVAFGKKIAHFVGLLKLRCYFHCWNQFFIQFNFNLFKSVAAILEKGLLLNPDSQIREIFSCFSSQLDQLNS